MEQVPAISQTKALSRELSEGFPHRLQAFTPEWLYELKFNGCRCLTRSEDGRVQLTISAASVLPDSTTAAAVPAIPFVPVQRASGAAA